MTNFIFKDMDARDVAHRIIKAEKDYLKTDVASLSFADKLYHLTHHFDRYHPLSCLGYDAKTLYKELYPELELRVKSNSATPDELYYYSLLSGEDEIISPYLDAAVAAGSAKARALKAYNIASSCPDEACRLLNEALSIHHSGEQTLDAVSHLACLKLLSERAADPEHRAYYKAQTDSMAERMALEGDYYPLAYLCCGNLSIRAEAGLEPHDCSFLFWNTVDLLVAEQVYAISGGRALADLLGRKLLNGNGCERDVERAKKIYIDAMLSFDYDRSTLLKLVGIPVIDGKECPEVVEYDCRRKIGLGKVAYYWKMILLCLLSGDREGMEKACDEAIARNAEAAIRNIPKAYHILRQAETQKEV